MVGVLADAAAVEADSWTALGVKVRGGGVPGGRQLSSGGDVSVGGGSGEVARRDVWRLAVDGWGLPGGLAGRRLMFVVTADVAGVGDGSFAGGGRAVVGWQGLTLPDGEVSAGLGLDVSAGGVETWSWMMPECRRRGFGLAARRAVLAAAFGLFAAPVCVSAHVEGNAASAGVSAAAGYLGPRVAGDGRVVWWHTAESWFEHVADLGEGQRPRLLRG